MATILLLGSRSAALSVVSGLLDTLGYHVLRADVPRHHERCINLTRAIIEFYPQDTLLPAFMKRIHLLKSLQTLVIGPDLPENQMAQILAPQHVAHYLKTTAPAHEKREALRTWLPETAHTVLTLGPLHLNVQDQTVHYGARPLMFTPIEIRLLRALMQRPGQRTDCATLGALVTCRDVQTHLGNIRRKLDLCSARPMLRGSPNQGYTLDARRHARHRADPSTALRIHLHSLI